MSPDVQTTEEILPSPGLEALANLGNRFEIIALDGQDVEIIRDGQKFEILCAYHAHPYCTLAEDRFVEAFYNPTDEWRLVEHKNQTVQIYLRDKQTLAAHRTSFPADLVLKKNGVRSAIVVSPSALAGLLCAPTDEYRTWVVFRPFNNNFLAPELAAQYPDLQKVPMGPITGELPKIDFPLLEGEEGRHNGTNSSFYFSALASRGVISKRERNLFKTVRGLYLEEDNRCKVLPPDNNRFKLDTESVQEMPDLKGRFVVLNKPEHRWPEMSDQQTRFMDTHPSSHGYLEFNCGRIVLEDGEYYFVLEKPLRTLDGLASYVYEIPQTKVDEIVSSTAQQLVS